MHSPCILRLYEAHTSSSTIKEENRHRNLCQSRSVCLGIVLASHHDLQLLQCQVGRWAFWLEPGLRITSCRAWRKIWRWVGQDLAAKRYVRLFSSRLLMNSTVQVYVRPGNGSISHSGSRPDNGSKISKFGIFALLTSSCWWYSKVGPLYILSSMFVTLLDENCTVWEIPRSRYTHVTGRRRMSALVFACRFEGLRRG